MIAPAISIKQQNELMKLVKERAEELIALVTKRHPNAHSIGPRYWAEENLWVIDAYFDQGEDFELEDYLSQRETDILLEDDVWLCVLCLPLDAFPG